MFAQWRMNSIQQDSDSSEDEFFDAQGKKKSHILVLPIGVPQMHGDFMWSEFN